MIQFGELLRENILYPLPHRQYIFTLPIILRKFFLYNRKLLSRLCKAVADSILVFRRTALGLRDGIFGTAITPNLPYRSSFMVGYGEWENAMGPTTSRPAIKMRGCSFTRPAKKIDIWYLLPPPDLLLCPVIEVEKKQIPITLDAREDKTMSDRECVQLLQGALPRLRLRWAGFRKVRGQVCKRIAQRIGALGLSGVPAYQAYLEHNPGEWATLDNYCRITISRFYRDQGVFRLLEQRLLPDLAHIALSQGKSTLACWCAGCASGEEPYSIAILWRLRLQELFPDLRLNLLATDADEAILERARQGGYQASSLKELPPPFLTAAFDWAGGRYRIRAPYRHAVQFLRHDLRHGTPGGPFDLILCRNCAFTYFDEYLQQEVVAAIREAMVPGGLLIIGSHENFPPEAEGFEPWEQRSGIYRKR